LFFIIVFTIIRARVTALALFIGKSNSRASVAAIHVGVILVMQREKMVEEPANKAVHVFSTGELTDPGCTAITPFRL